MGYAAYGAARARVFLLNGTDRDVRVGGYRPLHVLPLSAPSAMTSIEELAAGYLPVIQRTQPFGPYRLLGKTLGGLVAYELATQLLGRDERVEFLGMIDCPRPRNLPPPESDGEEAAALTERYCPQPLPIPVYYFVSDVRSEIETTRAWRALAGDSLRVIASTDPLSDDVLSDAIGKAPRQQFLQCAADQEEYRPLVTLRIGSSRETPVILVPGAGGNVMSCMNLAQSLNPQTTVHGLQPRGFNGTSVPHRTVQAAAVTYLRAIRQVQPCGPYRLVGHSFGGWVAFELACRLAAEGDTVDPVVLIDTHAPTSANAEPRHRGRVDALTKFIRVMEDWSERSMYLTRNELMALDYESQLSRLTQGMKDIGALSRRSDVNDIRGLVRIFEANLNTSYVPEARFPGSALLFQPTEHSGLIDEGEVHPPAETSHAWGAHVRRLESTSVPGGHMTMLKKPHVDAIAGHLSQLWSAASP